MNIASNAYSRLLSARRAYTATPPAETKTPIHDQTPSRHFQADDRTGHSYGQILKSTALIGGSSLINVGFSIIRMKAMALLLGPAGVGLMALYSSIADLTQTIAGLGIQASGVRQIAEAAGSGDTDRIARTSTVLKRVSIGLGLAGALLIVLLALPLSLLTFGDYAHAGNLALLSAAVLFGVVCSANLALLQGMRRIADLARISILSSMASTMFGITLVYFLGEDGIVPLIVLSAAASLAIAWRYSVKEGVRPPSLLPSQLKAEASALLKLGVAFMLSGLMTVGAAYAIRLIILRAQGFEAAGLYQAAWAVGGLYAGFILQAMGTDFYPRLTAVAHDDARCNRLVNEQTSISILLAGPGLLATLTVAPLLMRIFYSPEFEGAAGPLRWLCFGMMLRVVAWPMGFIVLARGARMIFFATELAATVVHVGLAWLLVPRVGVIGAGYAFFGLYVWHTGLIYFVVNRMSGFRWTALNMGLGLIFPLSVGLLCFAFQNFTVGPAMALGAAATLLSGVFSLTILWRLMPEARIWNWRLVLGARTRKRAS